ncbi:hypothetical protein IV203_000426 [Nitzschia inconspicua]|uniref:Agenet domain-containing protein n=1 Tax=Nitzschia inconspicua TaxID=303405 RepID=A0A9K3L6D7_9STRA|nr:hypothetical protein IV203_000426 [Nitzschia inconspicua]
MTVYPFPPTAAQLYCRAMFDPKPTTTETSQKQLAYALGYPMDWRVERTIAYDETSGKPIIRDRIHALGGKKNKTKFVWFNHEAAQKAAALFAEEGTLTPTTLPSNINNNNTGSHLLPPAPLYAKGDVVQVSYEGKWWEAQITKRKKKDDEFFYSVFYLGEDSTQDDIAEEDLRPSEDPGELAVSLGFTNDWKASRKGARYIITSPTGEQFTSKKAAMKVFNELLGKGTSKDDDVGDPPWRTEGHALIGKRIIWSFEHRASATRRIQIDQMGTVVGYIDAKDKDKNGNPGFLSESTGEPANLFHVIFEDQPSHPYAGVLLETQDFEEYEIKDKVIPEDVGPTGEASKKKKRKR